MNNTKLIEAVGKLVKAKGRYHTEQNYKAVVEAYDEALAERATEAGTPAKATIDTPLRLSWTRDGMLIEDNGDYVHENAARVYYEAVAIARAEDARREGFARGHAEGLEDGLATARLAAEGAQIRADEQRTAGGDWKHAANEWADVATNGLQWLKNVAEGVSTSADAIEALQWDITRVRAAQPVAEAAAQADDEGEFSTWTRAQLIAYIDTLKEATAAPTAQPTPSYADIDAAAWSIHERKAAQPTPPDDERAAFEKWMREEWECPEGDLKRTDLDTYFWQETVTAWAVWQARAALRQPGALPDHEIAALVNKLRDAAVEFRDAQQLRARIADIVVPALKRPGALPDWLSRLPRYEAWTNATAVGHDISPAGRWLMYEDVAKAAGALPDAAEDAARYRWLIEQVPCNVADAVGCDSIRKDQIDEEIDEHIARALAAKQAGKEA